jgi:hypothetical protein
LRRGEIDGGAEFRSSCSLRDLYHRGHEGPQRKFEKSDFFQ